MSSSTTPFDDQSLHRFAGATLYDQHRPSYPAGAVDTLLDAAGVRGVEGARIVDLAAGTGKLTELLAAKDEHFEIDAVEPHPDMRRELATKSLPGVTVLDGLSTAIPEESGTVEAVFAAQAFHWFANEASLREIHRVLKPGGVLALIWNAEDYGGPKSWPATTNWELTLRSHLFALEDITNDHAPRFRHDTWRQIFENQVSSTPLTAALVSGKNSLFSLPLGEDQERWTIWLDKEALWQRYRTLTHVAVLEGEKLESTRRLFDEALAGDDVERNDEGKIKVQGRTVMAWTSKIPE